MIEIIAEFLRALLFLLSTFHRARPAATVCATLFSSMVCDVVWELP